MTSIVPGHPCTWSLGVPLQLLKGRYNKVLCFRGYSSDCSNESVSGQGQYLMSGQKRYNRRSWVISSSAIGDGGDPDDSSEGSDKVESSEDVSEFASQKSQRENLERIVGTDDSAFSGLDLATLIRNKYGRSYDVQLIKKEFMGRNLLALNVMWKYREQRSFPLTEEEYLLRLDDVANNLKCWGAVSHIRNSLAKLKERPRIGKFTDLLTPKMGDES